MLRSVKFTSFILFCATCRPLVYTVRGQVNFVPRESRCFSRWYCEWREQFRCHRAVEVGGNARCLRWIPVLWEFYFFSIPGHNCEINTDDCASSPCQNGATCVDGVFSYICTCPSGWTGKNCDTDINECDLYVCQNNATCLNLDGTYNCTCKPGFSDFNCSTDIDECESSPCVNGNCTDLVNGFNCTCFPGYTGNLLKRKLLWTTLKGPCHTPILKGLKLAFASIEFQKNGPVLLLNRARTVLKCPWILGEVLELSSTLNLVAWKVFFDDFWLSKTEL